jgi:EAL domain-containing protein (putative c-di-GMP-specific phosphodiesterase class I)
MPSLDEILTNGSLHAVFQPIVNLSKNYEVLGYEALARYRNHALFRNPEVLFQYAARKQRVTDLETACVAATFRAAIDLPTDGVLFLNVHPHVLSDEERLPRLLQAASQRAGISLERVVLEITEQASLRAGRKLFGNIEELRSLGIRFALDDVGIAYSHLPLIDRVQPSFLKLSQHFGTSFERDATKLKIVINLQSLARDFGCDVIIEGVEHEATAELAERIGIKYGQGFLFGRPAEARALVS